MCEHECDWSVGGTQQFSPIHVPVISIHARRRSGRLVSGQPPAAAVGGFNCAAETQAWVHRNHHLGPTAYGVRIGGRNRRQADRPSMVTAGGCLGRLGHSRCREPTSHSHDERQDAGSHDVTSPPSQTLPASRKRGEP